MNVRRILILASLFACFTVSACQCSDKPDVGPVEGQDATLVQPEAVGADRV